jgi:hypothetical protein
MALPESTAAHRVAMLHFSLIVTLTEANRRDIAVATVNAALVGLPVGRASHHGF